MDTLSANGKRATAINPYKDEGWKEALAGAEVEVVNLVVNAGFGPQVIEQMAQLGIKNVFIQPGACDAKLLVLCEAHEIVVRQGCVLVEM